MGDQQDSWEVKLTSLIHTTLLNIADYTSPFLPPEQESSPVFKVC